MNNLTVKKLCQLCPKKGSQARFFSSGRRQSQPWWGEGGERGGRDTRRSMEPADARFTSPFSRTSIRAPPVCERFSHCQINPSSDLLFQIDVAENCLNIPAEFQQVRPRIVKPGRVAGLVMRKQSDLVELKTLFRLN